MGLDSATTVYAVARGKAESASRPSPRNLVVALAQPGKRVGVLDADVWGYSVPQPFGYARRRWR